MIKTGVITIMNSKQFLKYAQDNTIHDHAIMVISHELKVAKNPHFKNVYKLNDLLPTAKETQYKINYRKSDKFQIVYIDSLSHYTRLSILVTMVEAYLDGMKIILLCSKHEESEYDYLQLVADYIECTFGIMVLSYKEYKSGEKINTLKDKELCDRNLNYAKEYIDKTKKEIKKTEKQNEKELARTQLKDMRKKELKKICKEYDIEVDDYDDKKEMIKQILKTLY